MTETEINTYNNRDVKIERLISYDGKSDQETVQGGELWLGGWGEKREEVVYERDI